MYLCKALSKCKKLPLFTSSINQLLLDWFRSCIPAQNFRNLKYVSEKNHSVLCQKVKIFCTYFLPTITRTASCIIDRASSSTKSGNVALNNERTIEGLEHALTTGSICFNKSPTSNSLSASSRTRYSTLQTKMTHKGMHAVTA